MLWRAALVLVAAAAALLPLPTSIVERAYSTCALPRLQSLLTPVSNYVPFALSMRWSPLSPAAGCSPSPSISGDTVVNGRVL